MFNLPDKRSADRSSTLIKAIVKLKNSGDDFWQENADIADVSKNGAALFLSRKCQVGRLISLLIPLQPGLRLYDQDKELYRVWGIVQHCTLIKTNEIERFHVGIGFVGKFAPASYKLNPEQSYRIAGANDLGLWQIIEAEREFVNRKYPRYWITMDVKLSLVQNESEVDENELKEGEEIEVIKSETENISQKGAAVFSTLLPEVGEEIMFYCEEFNYETLPTVRHIRKIGKNLNGLHLEFPEADFPIDKIVLPFSDTDEQYPDTAETEN